MPYRHPWHVALRYALASCNNTMTTSARDWSSDRGDAWLYGILVGWDDRALDELATKHGWTERDVETICMYREAIRQMVTR